ncbi:MAG: hypothetical protein AAGK22_07405 [Acidobacteriota bacterium]
MTKKQDQVPEERLELYRRAIATRQELELKGGLKLPHTSSNGTMFSSLTKDGRLGLRLSEEDREAFSKEYDAVQFKNYGANIKEHLEVPEELFQQPEELGRWLIRALEYVNTLPAKKK